MIEFGRFVLRTRKAFRIADDVLKLYDTDRSCWVWMMKQSISKIASYFNSQRMKRRYASEAYMR